VAAVRPPAGAAARSKLADQRGLCCRKRLAEGKPHALSAAFEGRLRVRAPWHLSPRDARGDADHSVLLSHRPRNVQFVAGLPRQSVPWRSRRSRTRHRARRRGAEYRSRRGRPLPGQRPALGRAMGAASADAGAGDVPRRRDPAPGSLSRRCAPGGRPRGAGNGPRLGPATTRPEVVVEFCWTLAPSRRASREVPFEPPPPTVC
jgi:hypothetical protein